jgi:single-strand DNA-binding protein
MASFNKVILMGNLTRDPEVRHTTGGTAVCKLGLALNRRFRTAAGEDREEVCYVDIEVFRQQAESCGNYLRKGAPVLVEGHLRLDTWEDRETRAKRSRLLVQAERVQFLGGPSRDSDGFAATAPDGAGAAPRRGPRPTGDTPPAGGPGGEQEAGGEPGGDGGGPVDDIPF